MVTQPLNVTFGYNEIITSLLITDVDTREKTGGQMLTYNVCFFVGPLPGWVELIHLHSPLSGPSHAGKNASNTAIYSDFWVEAQVSQNPARNPRAGYPKKETIPLPPVGIPRDAPATRLVFCWQRKTHTLG